MLVLCVHAAKHSWMQLSYLCDIAQLARSRALDWAALQAEAARLGIARLVAVTFLLAHKLLGAPLPAGLDLHRDPAAEPLTQRVLQRIVSDAEFDPESVSYFRLMMDLRERRRDRASFLWRLCVTPGPGEWSAIRLPGSVVSALSCRAYGQAGWAAALRAIRLTAPRVSSSAAHPRPQSPLHNAAISRLVHTR
jgi:hypothetical protein